VKVSLVRNTSHLRYVLAVSFTVSKHHVLIGGSFSSELNNRTPHVVFGGMALLGSVLFCGVAVMVSKYIVQVSKGCKVVNREAIGGRQQQCPSDHSKAEIWL
jgi:hypothetical protein